MGNRDRFAQQHPLWCHKSDEQGARAVWRTSSSNNTLDRFGSAYSQWIFLIVICFFNPLIFSKITFTPLAILHKTWFSIRTSWSSLSPKKQIVISILSCVINTFDHQMPGLTPWSWCAHFHREDQNCWFIVWKFTNLKHLTVTHIVFRLSIQLNSTFGIKACDLSRMKLYRFVHLILNSSELNSILDA